MTHVKTCGVVNAADAEICLAAGADALGFVVEYPDPVPWTLTRSQARALAREVRGAAECVAVVGGDIDTILAIVAAVEPDAVQLHRDEPPETVAAVKAAVGPAVDVVRAVRIPVGDTGTVEHWAGIARTFLDAGADRILLDSKTAAMPAGTGQPVDWSVAAGVVATLGGSVVLAGGLTPENVAAAVTQVRPWGVDVISGIESPEHRKVPERVRAFVAAARGERAT